MEEYNPYKESNNISVVILVSKKTIRMVALITLAFFFITSVALVITPLLTAGGY
ncbi:MAG TPA: hypothetical protein PK566_02900 [Pseudobacteroides sp.]|nr:hypothetical protein [Pseudobacteroides sp.]